MIQKSERYTSNCTEQRLVSVLTEVVAGWMNEECKAKYRSAIGNAVRRMSADFVGCFPQRQEFRFAPLRV